MIVAHLRGREPALPHRRPDRRAHRGDAARADRRSAALAALEEYAVEASIAKVAGSETLDFVLDENIQIHGGNGFVRDYPAERHYRDARVNRIFEGTNEINRLLIPGMLARRAVKGELPLIAGGQGAAGRAARPAVAAADGRRRRSADERRAVAAFKKMALMVLGTAMQTYGAKLDRRAGSADAPRRHPDRRLQRRERGAARGRRVAAGTRGARCTPTPRASSSTTRRMRIEPSARQALAAMADGDTLRTMLAALRRLLKVSADQHGGAAAASRRRDGRRDGRLHRSEPTRSAGSTTARGLNGRVRSCAGPPVGAACPCAGVRRRRATGRPTTRRTTPAKIAAARAAKDASFQKQPTIRSRRTARRELLPLAYFPIDPDYDVAGRRCKPVSDDTSDLEMPTSTGQPAPDAPRRHARVHAEGPAAEADRVRRGRRAEPESPVRAVQRSDQRHRNLSRRPLSRSRSQPAPASTSSTSTARTSRTATTTPPTSVRYPPAENRLKIPIRAGERLKKTKSK